MKRRAALLSAIFCMLPLALAAQEAAGTLKSVRGQTLIEREGVKRAARAGEALLVKDRILTLSDGFAAVGFRDQSSLAIGPNSDVDLSKYSFNPTTHQGEQQVRVRSGSLASISGKVAKASPEAVQFNVGTVTLGVRGTQFVAEVHAGSQTPALLWRDSQKNVIRTSDGHCWQAGSAQAGCPTKDRFVLLPDRTGRTGAITLTDSASTVLVDKAYAGLEIEDQTSRRVEFSESDIQARYKDLLSTLPPASQTFVVRFVTGSSTQLAPDSRVVLDQIKEALLRWPVAPNVDVVGHTDTAGRAEQNDALSLQRAKTVSQWIEAASLSAERLHVSGRGERELLVPTADEVSEPRNRRVEVTLH